jgi:hypothetical protein
MCKVELSSSVPAVSPDHISIGIKSKAGTWGTEIQPPFVLSASP